MRLKFLASAAPLLIAASVVAGSLTACAPHRNEYYDSGYNDHHRWNDREEAAYVRWEQQQHMRHIEFDRRQAAEQNAYWAWRHQHPG
jgi:hypothetical protein